MIGWTAWIALLVSVAANVASNIAFKRFMDSATLEPSWPALRSALLTPSLWIGLVCAGIVLAAYLFAIRLVPLGVAYATATSLSAFGIAAAGVLLFGETLKTSAMIGIALVIGGVLLIAR